MGRKKITIEEIKKRVTEKHGDTLVIREETYHGLQQRAIFIDILYGEKEMFVNGVLAGSQHPDRSRKERTISVDIIKERLKTVHGDTIILIESTYVNKETICIFYHKVHKEFPALPYNVLNGDSHPAGRSERRRETCLDLYGVDHPCKSDQVKKKFKKTCMDKFGVDAPMKSKEVREKSKKTCNEKYGFDNPLQNEEIKNKSRKTCQERYGKPSPNQNIDIVKKTSRNLAKTTVKHHWKTGEELVCQAGWEPKVVDYLNTKKIDYNWQPKIFEIPKEIMVTEKGNSTTYRPDVYLPEKDIWIEIKGRMYKDAQQKWDWFKYEHPTAELWDQKKLKEMGIL